MRRHANLQRVPATVQFVLQKGINGIQRTPGAISPEMDIGAFSEIDKRVVPPLPVFRFQYQSIPARSLHGNGNLHPAHLLQPSLQLQGSITLNLRSLAVQDNGIGRLAVLK